MLTINPQCASVMVCRDGLEIDEKQHRGRQGLETIIQDIELRMRYEMSGGYG